MKRGNGSSVGRLWDDVQSIGFYCSQGLDPSTLSSSNFFDLPCVPQAVLEYQRGCGFYSESVYIGVFGPSQLVFC